jgi:hypothetical protein
MKTPIFGHTSLETAYLIADYPYGRTLRCQRRVWLEYDPKKGVRFVAQTENPKNGRWNKPHMSTYMHIAGGLYLDADSHVQWEGVGYHTSAEQALAFVQTFGTGCVGAERLRAWAIEKAHMCKALATGKAHFTINGEKQERSEADKMRDTNEAQVWVQVVEALKA